MDDAPTSPIPDRVTNRTPEAPPAPGASTTEPGIATPEPAQPQAWAPTEPEAVGPARAPVSNGRAVARSTFLAGLVVAAALGVVAAGILFSLRDQVTDTASVGAPYGIHGEQDGRPGQDGDRARGSFNGNHDRGTWSDAGRHGQQGRADGRMPDGGGRHGGDEYPGQDGDASTPAPRAPSTPTPDASGSPETTQSPP